MGDIIKLLPDAIANQIAAGEVIQRPASVVKELLENAIDAGASEVNLVVQDAGKTRIQVTDNGSGMSETDARRSLERHATSKINNAQDLFAIRTMGFRGEALASIASISQMSIRSKLTDAELGTLLEIAGSTVENQEPVQCKNGTTISVKNLFYNVPARRKFLKSDHAENRKIIDEFERVALIHPTIKFTYRNNDHEIFHLERANLRKRIIQVFGKKYTDLLIPIEEETNILTLKGFLVKPEGAKKTRGEQFFFVNDRFIKSPSLHHALVQATKDLIPSDYHPGYFIGLHVDPSFIDINIHPTKTEIKFEDERAVYSILHSSARKAIASNNIAPTIDFNTELSFDSPLPNAQGHITPPEVKVNKSFNPFDASNSIGTSRTSISSGTTLDQFYANAVVDQSGLNNEQEAQLKTANFEEGEKTTTVFQLHNKYLLAHIRSGFMIVHQHRAHVRVLFEKYLKDLAQHEGGSQQQLFPETVEFSAKEAAVLAEILEDLRWVGFDINAFGKNSFVVQGIPAHTTEQGARSLLQGFLADFIDSDSNSSNKQELIAASLARKTSIKSGVKLEERAMKKLIDELFACENPYSSPSGKTILSTVTLEELDKRF